MTVLKPCLTPIVALSLAGCAGLGALVAPPPVAAANKTVLDEQSVISAELAYKAARTAVEMAVDTGRLTGDNAAKAAELDRKAFEALAFVRAAYRSKNAADYGTALQEGRAAISALLATIG